MDVWWTCVSLMPMHPVDFVELAVNVQPLSEW